MAIPWVIVISLCFAHSISFAEGSAKDLLKQAMNHFDKGQYQRALDALASVDIRSSYDNSDDMKTAFKIRSIAHEQTKNHKACEETIRELLFIDPEYQFNLFDTPQEVVAIADKVKAEINFKSEQLSSLKKNNEPSRVLENNLLLSTKKIAIDEKPITVVNFFPLGINHFYLGSPVKGGIYLSLQSLGLAANIAAFWWKSSYLVSFGSPHLKDPQTANNFSTAQVIQYVGFGAFIISYATSVLDALIHFRRMSTQKT